jgi:subtilisin-like proprotein convertase family protein
VTNVEECVSVVSNPSAAAVNLDMYLRRARFPTASSYDKGLLDIGAQGDCLNYGLLDQPPLSPGRYFAGIFNDRPEPITVRLVVRLSRSLEKPPPLTFAENNTMPLLDDATTNSSIFIATQAVVSGVEVDVRIDHPRASDLVLYLQNPQGTRVMLAENRGRTNAFGYGYASTNVVITNFGARVLDDSFEYVSASSSPYYCPANVPAGEIVSGWLIYTGHVDVAHGTFGACGGTSIIGPAHTGTNCIDLNGLTRGGISTNVTTKVGQTYLLTFAYSCNPERIPETAQVTAGPATTNLSYNLINSYADLKWLDGAMLLTATSNITPVKFLSTSGSDGGIYIDTVRMEEVKLVTNSTLYATFTEDLSKLPVPIKFAPPPFGDTNFRGTNVFISGFETGTNANVFTNGQQFDGWTVLTNSVFIRTNASIAYSGTNSLLLRRGIISRTIPTEPNKEYVLTFATRSSGQIIYNTGVDNDNLPLWPGELDPHYRTNGASVGTAVTNAYVLSTNAMASTWFAKTNGASRWIGITPSTTNIPPGSYTFRTTFDLRGYDTNTVALNCNFAADDAVTAVLLNGVLVAGFGGNPNGFTSLNINNLSGAGFRQLGNTLDFIVTNSLSSGVPTAMGLRVEPTITGTLRPNSLPRVFSSIGQVRLRGSYTNNFAALSDGWRVEAITFVAQSNSVTLDFEGVTHGVWLDHIQMRDTGRKYYLPEEPMAPLLGQQSFGDWTLQIWDSRLSQFLTNGNVLSWRLNLSYVRTNSPFTVLSNAFVASGKAATSDFTYFAVDVPCDGGHIDVLINNASGPLQAWFNQDMVPTGTQPGDVLLGIVPTAPGSLSYSFDVGFYPLSRAGRFFIGLKNGSGTGTNTFQISAQISCPFGLNPSGGLFISVKSFNSGAFNLSWYGNTNAEFHVLYADDPNGPWNVFPTNVTSSDGTFIFKDDGSVTGGLPPRRFYKLQQTK